MNENVPFDATFQSFFTVKYAKRFLQIGGINLLVNRTLGRIPILKYLSGLIIRGITFFYIFTTKQCTLISGDQYMCNFETFSPDAFHGIFSMIVGSIWINILNSEWLLNKIPGTPKNSFVNSIISSVLVSLYFTYLSKDSAEYIFPQTLNEEERQETMIFF